MAYDKIKLYNQALEIAEKKNCFFIEQIISFMPCSKTTLYEFFPIDSNEMNAIKDIIESNRIDTKTKMYKKWFDSENATLQIGLMKLIASDEEAHRLNGSKQEVKSTVIVEQPLFGDE